MGVPGLGMLRVGRSPYAGQLEETGAWSHADVKHIAQGPPNRVAIMTDEERNRPDEMTSESEERSVGAADRRPPSARMSSTGLPPTNEDADLGTALRSVYQRTVEEEIPQEMLDLLNRLT